MPRSAKVLFWLIGFPLVLTVYGLMWLFLFIDTFGVEPPRDRPRQPRSACQLTKLFPGDCEVA